MEEPSKQNENQEVKPKYLSFFASGFEREGFQEKKSDKNLPTSDINSVDEKITSHINLEDGDYLEITKTEDQNIYRFTFRFLTSGKTSTRKGSCAGISLYFENYIPNPVTLIKSIKEALRGFKNDNYESEPSKDGRLILKKDTFKNMEKPEIFLDTKDKRKILDNIKSPQEWFTKIYDEELQNLTSNK